MARQRTKKASLLGENIRRLRGDVTQEELAEKAGLSRPTIGKLESGMQTGADYPTLEKLAHGLGVRVADLFLEVPQRVAMAKLLEDFDRSRWAAMTQLTQAERDWLLSVEFGFFQGIEPLPETLHHIVLARRASLATSSQ